MKRSLLLLPLLLPAVSGCSVITRVATEAALKKLGVNSSGGSSGADTAYAASLKPVDSGHGLIVFEPQAAKSAAKWANLGAGCSRYLQVHVAGQGALGKTPLWGAVEDARDVLKLPDLRFTAAQARQAAPSTGATRVAVGQLSGNDARLTLSYQLLDVASGKVLATVQSSAAPAQMPAQLPLLARQLSAKLGIAKPALPPRVALTSEELAFLGGQKWKLQRTKIAPADEARLKALAPKDALTGVLAQRNCYFPTDPAWQKVADDLLKSAPGNALVASEVAWMGPNRFMRHTATLDAMNKRYPRNYLLCTARMKFERENKSRPLEIKWAENAVRANPRNSLAWIEVANAHYNTAHDLRNFRYARNISAAEWKKLNFHYPKSHAATLHATQIDPQNAFAWSKLSSAAAFNSDGDLAESALWKSLALDPANQHSYDWGLQQCQPKWGGDAASVLKMAQFAANNADKAYIDAEAISTGLDETNQRPALRGILQTITTKDPTNATALTELAMIYHYFDRNYGPAEPLYRKALKSNPDHARANSGLGDLMFFVHNDPKTAEAMYRKAIAQDPRDGYFHANLARCLASTGRKAEGIAEAKLAKSFGFDDENHQVWGLTGVQP